MQRDTDANDWIEIDRLKIEHAKQNIAFLEGVLVSNDGQFLSDTTLPVYYRRLRQLSKHYRRLGV